MTRDENGTPSFFLDTNIFIYAAGAAHPLREPCVRVLRSATTGKITANTSVEVLQELLHRYSALDQAEKGIELCRKLLVIFEPVLPIQTRDIKLALDLSHKYPHLENRDTLHAAVSLNNGMRRIVSTDRHFDSLKEIRRVAPDDLA